MHAPDFTGRACIDSLDPAALLFRRIDAEHAAEVDAAGNVMGFRAGEHIAAIRGTDEEEPVER